MKVALVHDWLTGMRGGERCLEVFCEIFPAADIFTLLHVKGAVSSTIEKHHIQTSFIQRLPLSSRWYRNYLPLFPLAIKSFDLEGYDLVISSSHCVAKGIPVPAGTCHVAYIFTPMRYIWDQFDVYFSTGGVTSFLRRNAMRVIRPWLQEWDRSSNKQVDSFLTISEHVAGRIRSYWDQKSRVVYSPVNWQAYATSYENEGFYLMVTSLVPYKRVDLAIKAANRLGIPLKIIGQGPEMKRLMAIAGPSVQLLGWQSDLVVSEHLARCKALIFPGEEDFGIVPLEAMSCGKPVIAFGKGGVLETVIPLNPQHESIKEQGVTGKGMHSENPTGVFFYEQNTPSLIEALHLFERHQDCFDPALIRQHVAPFDRIHFKRRIQEIFTQCVHEFRFASQC
ncbi:MAG: glycosyltransferase [Nitrospirales bacterium]|nr:glycosyltransferase [Nitrospirales bacterium]